MKFSTILTVIIIGYVIYYAYLILSDFFSKKDTIGVEKLNEEEEVDISGESANFKPENVAKKNTAGSHSDDSQSRPLTVNTGAVNIDEFLAIADDFAENGEMSVAGKLCALWGATY